jgi:hypothetical protein
MKQRNGFVSNSSSSSFIVAFPNGTLKLPEDQMKARLKELLFDGQSFVGVYPVDDVVASLYKDISSEDDSAIVQIKCTCPHCGNDVGGVIVNEEEDEPRWKSMGDDEDVKVFIKLHPGLDVCYFVFGDECGDYYSTLENSDIFNNVPNVRVNHH